MAKKPIYPGRKLEVMAQVRVPKELKERAKEYRLFIATQRHQQVSHGEIIRIATECLMQLPEAELLITLENTVSYTYGTCSAILNPAWMLPEQTRFLDETAIKLGTRRSDIIRRAVVLLLDEHDKEIKQSA